MKNLFIAVLLLLSCAVYSQSPTESKLNSRTRKLSIGAFFTPTYNYRHLNSQGSNNLVAQIRNAEEVAKAGFCTGIIIEHQLSNSFSLQYGLSYANRGFKTSIQQLNWTDPSITHFSAAYISQRYNYLDFSFRPKYHIALNESLTWFVSSGMSMAFLFSSYQRNHVKVSDAWQVTNDELPIASLSIFLIDIETGIDYHITSRLSLRTTLYLQQAISATNPNFQTQEYLYNTGPSLGIVFHL